MKIGVIGAGAVGGYLGARLIEAGFDVTFVELDDVCNAIKVNGINVKSIISDVKVETPAIYSDMSVIAEKDIILLAVKSYDTEKVAHQIKNIISDKAVVVSMQNGIENEKILSEILGEDKVIGAAVYISCNVPQSGNIVHTSLNKLYFGRINGKNDEKVNLIAEIFSKTVLETVISDEINKELWQKLMINIPFNGFTALTGGPLEKYYSVKEAQESFYNAMKEVQQVAIAEGINISDKSIDESFQSFTNSDGFDKTITSTLQDMKAGKQLEIDYFQGTVIKLAEKHGINVPINKLLYALIMMSLK